MAQIAVGKRNLQDVAAEIQHRGRRDGHACSIQCGTCRIQTGFQLVLLCYQPGDEHK